MSLTLIRAITIYKSYRQILSTTIGKESLRMQQIHDNNQTVVGTAVSQRNIDTDSIHPSVV